MYEQLDGEFNFDDDPFPYPRPPDYNALEVEWGQCSYVNASFRAEDAGHSFSKVIRKAIEESKMGKTVVLAVPCSDAMTMLLRAGAEIRPLGRVNWLHTKTREPCPHPGNAALCILHGSPPTD